MNEQKKCLVIGYGSIGKRHIRILNELGHRVAVVSRRQVEYPTSYTEIEVALKNEEPDYIVVANRTSEHEDTLITLKRLGYTNKILVEKPLFSVSSSFEHNFNEIYVGYNLRFHELIQTLFMNIQDKKVISVQCYVGQYLPSWRPGTDYRNSYSASILKGGGVLRDLSHELDYLRFLFGEWKQLTASGGKLSNLIIESDDHFSLVFSTENVPLINIHMNYLDHITQRVLIVNTNYKTYKVDFINNTLQINEEIHLVNVNRNDSYRKQHIAVLNGETDLLCSYNDALKIINIIEKAELASQQKVWVLNE